MKNIMKTLVVVSFALIAQGAIAGSVDQKAVSFDDLKHACQDPARFHNQVAPANIQVACKDSVTKWLPSSEGAVNLPTSRFVTHSFQSDKYAGAAVTETIASANQVVGCPRFKQITETVAMNRAATCEEIVAFPGTGTEFCAAALAELRSANPESVQVAETGRTAEFCSTASAPRGQR